MNIHPMVARKDGKMRIGKGFSKSELREAGLDFKQALRLTIPVDLRRETKHEENVNALRQHLGVQVPKIKPPEQSRKLPRPVKAEVTETKPTKAKKPTKQKEVTKSLNLQSLQRLQRLQRFPRLQRLKNLNLRNRLGERR